MLSETRLDHKTLRVQRSMHMWVYIEILRALIYVFALLIYQRLYIHQSFNYL